MLAVDRWHTVWGLRVVGVWLQWKERNAAVSSVEAVLAGAGGRIEPTVNDLLSALKVRA